MNRRLLISIAAACLTAVGCGVKSYTTFEPPQPLSAYGDHTFFQDSMLSAGLSAVCDPAQGSNAYFVTFRGLSTQPVTIRTVDLDVVMKEPASETTLDAGCFSIETMDPAAPSAEPISVSRFDVFPVRLRVLEQSHSEDQFRRYSFDTNYTCLRNRYPDPTAVSVTVSFTVDSAPPVMIRRVVKLVRTPHRYWWFLRDC